MATFKAAFDAFENREIFDGKFVNTFITANSFNLYKLHRHCCYISIECVKNYNFISLPKLKMYRNSRLFRYYKMFVTWKLTIFYAKIIYQ